jgi:HAD superfamily hydrolase (TIGR01509 family)
VHGLANRKREALLRRLEQHGVDAYAGSRRYLEAARDAGLGCAVVSASAHTDALLARAGLAPFVRERVGGKPAPELLLPACSRLGVDPGEAAAFVTSAAGVAAARAAGFRLVVGVDAHGGEALAGADVVAAGLAELLEH